MLTVSIWRFIHLLVCWFDCFFVLPHSLKKESSGRWFGAICASPAVVLHTHGLLTDIASVTAHPNFKSKLPAEQTTKSNDPRVVVSGNCVTSIGPGSSIEYALKIVELLCGVEKAKAVAEPMYPLLPGATTGGAASKM